MGLLHQATVRRADHTPRYDLSSIAAVDASGHPLLDGTPAASRRFDDAVHRLLDDASVRYRRLWAYYANPERPAAASDGVDRSYRQAQEWGLPARVTGVIPGREPFSGTPAGTPRKEVVIENNIGWRVDACVDFLFGRPVVIESDACDPMRAAVVADVVRGVIAANGGLAFLQGLALVGAVYGSADVFVKLDPWAGPTDCVVAATADTGGLAGDAAAVTRRAAAAVRLEVVEPARALPVAHPADARRLCAYAQVYRVPGPHEGDDDVVVVEVAGPRGWQSYRDGRLTAAGPNPLGRVPVVHVQNMSRPFAWEGAGDVEPLIPLQDELNTRLSDRAHRVTLQSQKMYLGVGVDGFAQQRVQPGRMWESDNPDARVTAFGGGDAAYGEEEAIRDAREALDRASGVNPAFSGALRGRVGHLASGTALRMTFQPLLARNARKRANYGEALARVCELALARLDACGLFATCPDERRVRVVWPDPLPADDAQRLAEARLKRQIGVPRDTVLRELGYADPSDHAGHSDQADSGTDLDPSVHADAE